MKHIINIRNANGILTRRVFRCKSRTCGTETTKQIEDKSDVVCPHCRKVTKQKNISLLAIGDQYE